MPSGMSRVYRNFEDIYNVQLPDEVFNKYQPLRESFYIEALSNLHDLIKSQAYPVSVEDLDDLENESIKFKKEHLKNKTNIKHNQSNKVK